MEINCLKKKGEIKEKMTGESASLMDDGGEMVKENFG